MLRLVVWLLMFWGMCATVCCNGLMGEGFVTLSKLIFTFSETRRGYSGITYLRDLVQAVWDHCWIHQTWPVLPERRPEVQEEERYSSLCRRSGGIQSEPMSGTCQINYSNSVWNPVQLILKITNVNKFCVGNICLSCLYLFWLWRY